ncbi:hypothetical protein KIJ96_21380 (plasmid) [Pseudoalteromonas piscicida]|uniref:hypothetical protein n=1 Tax=Pseudoalteromonas TaxID=53246 RepID=UPI001573D4C0|nr:MULTISPECIES: hypothetical protein [Pseudoalteromonas]MCF7515470.1 hypothetical protein [Pseudoalteromonas sp. L7]MCF7527351.1 hypothetical protein [Pseudoalteromonas sp. L23]MCX2767733.1 hypothetical protein [Pseudoalteromonas sp. B530]UDM63513.1 hypothetical protein KIJ96_21380 [Pseudoalteromonas piscicida]
MKSLYSLMLPTSQKKPTYKTLCRSVCEQIYGGTGYGKGDGAKPQATENPESEVGA